MLNASARSRSDHPPCRLLLFLRCYLAMREISFSKQAVVEHVIRHPDVMPQNCRQKTKLGPVSIHAQATRHSVHAKFQTRRNFL